MNAPFEAIYENGVLRPLNPLQLREHELVTVWIAPALERAKPHGEVQHAAEHDRAAAWARVLEDLEKIPQPTNADGFSSRDHDRVLYSAEA